MNLQKERPPLSTDGILIEDAFVEMPHSKPPKRKNVFKRNRFRPFLAVYAILLFVLSGGALFAFNTTLADYEAATPNAALRQYEEWLRNKDYLSIFQSAQFTETPLNDKDSYLQYFARVYNGTPTAITFRERAAKTEGQKQFSVYFDNTRVDILDLVPLKEQNGWRVVPQLVYQNDYLVYAAAETRVTVNGQDFSLLGITPTPVQETVFCGLKDTSLYPTVNCYTLSGLLNPPIIEGLTLSGETCTVTHDAANPQQIYVLVACSEETRIQQEELAKTAAFTYAKFVTRDASLNELLPFIYKESSLYDTIRRFGNDWFSSHESYKFTDEELQNPIRYTNRDFTYEVKFQPYYIKGGRTHKGELVHNRLTFLKFGDDWKLISLTPVADNSDSTTASTNANNATTTATTT